MEGENSFQPGLLLNLPLTAWSVLWQHVTSRDRVSLFQSCGWIRSRIIDTVGSCTFSLTNHGTSSNVLRLIGRRNESLHLTIKAADIPARLGSDARLGAIFKEDGPTSQDKKPPWGCVESLHLKNIEVGAGVCSTLCTLLPHLQRLCLTNVRLSSSPSGPSFLKVLSLPHLRQLSLIQLDIDAAVEAGLSDPAAWSACIIEDLTLDITSFTSDAAPLACLVSAASKASAASQGAAASTASAASKGALTRLALHTSRRVPEAHWLHKVVKAAYSIPSLEQLSLQLAWSCWYSSDLQNLVDQLPRLHTLSCLGPPVDAAGLAALLQSSSLQHLTVSNFTGLQHRGPPDAAIDSSTTLDLSSPSADRCSWKQLVIEDLGYVSVHTLAHLPLHSLTHPFIITRIDLPSEPVGIPAAAIAAKLRSAVENMTQRCTVLEVARRTLTLANLTGALMGDEESNGASHILRELAPLQYHITKLILANMALGPKEKSALATSLGTSLQVLDVHSCTVLPGFAHAPSDLWEVMPMLSELWFTASTRFYQSAAYDAVESLARAAPRPVQLCIGRGIMSQMSVDALQDAFLSDRMSQMSVGALQEGQEPSGMPGGRPCVRLRAV